jgi:hypothetical protein
MVSANRGQVRLTITETEPVPLVKDFLTFIAYVTETDFRLTDAGQYIPPKRVHELNGLLTHPMPSSTPRTKQPYHPQVHLFYHLALSGKLCTKVPVRSRSLKLTKTERLDDYLLLTPAEKYFFLLETFWVDCNWRRLVEHAPTAAPLCDAEDMLSLVGRAVPGRPIPKDRIAKDPILEGSFLQYLALFGFFELTRDREKDWMNWFEGFFPVAAVMPSVLGVTLAPVLLKECPLELWNLPLRRYYGEPAFLPGLEADEHYEERYVPFSAAFIHLVAPGSLQCTLPRAGQHLTEGVFVFMVSLGPSVWRKIAISSHLTLNDLHLAIQSAFRFADDHLYAFFMDGECWSDDCFNDRRGEEGPFADDVTIGELDLHPNQAFLYLFDFGDHWQFRVRLLEIRDQDARLQRPVVIARHGRAPRQYD